jgi:hypothetical protein
VAVLLLYAPTMHEFKEWLTKGEEGQEHGEANEQTG